jgi:hypothetical protein
MEDRESRMEDRGPDPELVEGEDEGIYNHFAILFL